MDHFLVRRTVKVGFVLAALPLVALKGLAEALGLPKVTSSLIGTYLGKLFSIYTSFAAGICS
jgi:hypothetical protein